VMWKISNPGFEYSWTEQSWTVYWVGIDFGTSTY